MFRYVCERLDEAEILAIARSQGVRNCAVTRLVADGDGWRLTAYNLDAHLTEHGSPVTAEPPVGEALDAPGDGGTGAVAPDTATPDTATSDSATPDPAARGAAAGVRGATERGPA